MLRFANAAIPLEGEVGGLPDSVPPLGFVPIATETTLVAVVTRLPPRSCSSTCTGGVMVAPPAVLDGCKWKPSCAGGPTEMVNALDVAPVSPVALAVRV